VCVVVPICTRGLVHEAVPSYVRERIDAVVALQHTGDCASIQNARGRVGTGWLIRWRLIELVVSVMFGATSRISVDSNVNYQTLKQMLSNRLR
jgi:predicted Kef-type K+ transport protein